MLLRNRSCLQLSHSCLQFLRLVVERPGFSHTEASDMMNGMFGQAIAAWQQHLFAVFVRAKARLTAQQHSRVMISMELTNHLVQYHLEYYGSAEDVDDEICAAVLHNYLMDRLMVRNILMFRKLVNGKSGMPTTRVHYSTGKC